MNYPPDPDNDTMFGLFYSLLLSLENRGILNKGDFTSDLEQILDLAGEDKLLKPSVLSEISRVKSWIEDQGSRIPK